MTPTQTVDVGRVIRVGPGWLDVTVDHKVRRVIARPDLLVRAGCFIQLHRDQVVAVLPPSEQHTSRRPL